MTVGMMDLFDDVLNDLYLDIQEPLNCWTHSRFRMTSTTLWAVNELRAFVLDHSDMSILDAIRLFVNQMKRCKRMNDSTSYIFEIAQNIGEQVLDIMEAMI